MKRTMIVIMLFLSIKGVSQSRVIDMPTEQGINPKGTTIEEYNYVTKGYQIQISSGLDMKKGYSLVSITNIMKLSRNVQIKALYRTNDKQPCAIMLHYINNEDKESFLCIPRDNSDPEIWAKFWESYNNYSNDAQRVIIYSLAKASAYFAERTKNE